MSLAFSSLVSAARRFVTMRCRVCACFPLLALPHNRCHSCALVWNVILCFFVASGSLFLALLIPLHAVPQGRSKMATAVERIATILFAAVVRACPAGMATFLSVVVVACCSALPLLLSLVLAVPGPVLAARARRCCYCSCSVLLAPCLLLVLACAGAARSRLS